MNKVVEPPTKKIGPWAQTWARALARYSSSHYRKSLSATFELFFHFGNPFIKDRSRKLWKGRKGPRLNPPRFEIREMLMMRRRNNGILMSRPSLLCRAARACIFIRCNSLNGFSLVRTQARDFYEQTWSKKMSGTYSNEWLNLLIDNQASSLTVRWQHLSHM